MCYDELRDVSDQGGSDCCFEVRLAEARVVFSCARDWETELKLIFPELRRLETATDGALCSLRACVDGEATYSVLENRAPVVTGVSRAEALVVLASRVTSNIVDRTRDDVALHAGCVARNGRAVLLAGDSGAGKSTLTAWLVDQGFDFLGDELVVLSTDRPDLTVFPRAMMLRRSSLPLLSAMPRLAAQPSKRIADDIIVNPPRPNGAVPACKIILFPHYAPNSGLTVTPLSPAQACKRLMQCNVNAENLADGGLGAIAGLARDALALELRYGGFEQLAEVIDDLKTYLLDGDVAPEEARRLVGTLAQSAKIRTGPDPQGRPVPLRTPNRRSVKMTIGMATYDDYDGVYFSLQALRLYHPDVVDDAELIVVDNNPGGKCAEALKKLEGHIPNYRYIPQTSTQGTAVPRQRVFSEASGAFVLCMDCHVLLLPGALRALLDYFDANPATRDLVQGPLLADNLQKACTHLAPVWRGGMFGTWDSDDRANDPTGAPFEIPMQGLGLFACRKDAWPGFNPGFRGFGGEEGYIHEKFRKAGGRTLCLPALRWVHRFDRPLGIPYRNVWEDRIWNYLLGFTELGLDTSELEAHFAEFLGPSKAQAIIRNLKRQLPMAA